MRQFLLTLAVSIAVLVAALSFSRYVCAETSEPTDESEGEPDESEGEPVPVVPEDQWNDDVKLWLARSVLGEAGWRRFDEYSAIAFVYAERAEQSASHDFLDMVRTYSAAVKPGNHHRNPWLFELGLHGERPRSWPFDPETKSGPLWSGLHREAWIETLAWADEWQAGKRANPCPGANHFGGWIDRHRAVAARWTPIKCETRMRNRFYTSLRLVSKRQRM